VVSDTAPPERCSAVTHEQPVTNRIKIPRRTEPVGDAATVTTHGMVDLPHGQQGLRGLPDRVCGFGFERAHNLSSTGWGCVFAARYQTRDGSLVKADTVPEVLALPHRVPSLVSCISVSLAFSA